MALSIMRLLPNTSAVSDGAQAKELWPTSGYHGPVEPAEEAAFDAHCQARLVRSGRIGAGLALAANLLFWPLDLIIYRGVSEAPSLPVAYRIVISISCLLFLALPHRHPMVRRYSFFMLVSLLCAIMASMGYTGAWLGGLDRPWFYMALPVLCATMIFPMRLHRRVLMVALQAVSWLGCVFLTRPQNLHSPYLGATLSMVVLVSLYSLLMGHYLTALLRDNFRQSLQIADNAEALEGKVAEKTAALRQLLNQLEQAREAERARIARDLHDELGQELTALRYALGLTSERFRRDPAGIGRNLSELDHLLGRTNRTVRSLVGQLRPMILDDLGLSAAVEWLLARASERSGLQVRAKLSADDTALPAELSNTVFRIVQESLTNVMRHAQARSVEVELTRQAAHLQLRIRDDGVGFDVDRTRSGQAGVGLIGMRERALALGVELQIKSQPGAGTEVRAEFAIPPAPAAPVVEGET